MKDKKMAMRILAGALVVLMFFGVVAGALALLLA